ncbi:MAG TPA: ribonuclease HI family protein [Clostridia bacterium]|nr:ribonuclease HI family protein [Clostridia bacterium]
MPFRRAPFRTKSSHDAPGLFGERSAQRPEAAEPAGKEWSGKDALLAHIDGGARGNPGPAGYGVYIQDATGKKVAELSEYLGHQTNNFAEYSGLVAALEYAIQHGYKTLKVVSDSELMVKQIRGEYKVKSESLAPIYAEAKELIRKLDSFSIRHALREQNKDADRLANLAMDRGTGRAPAALSKPAPAPDGGPALCEVEGVVRDGVVEFTAEDLPNGTRVRIRPVR